MIDGSFRSPFKLPALVPGVTFLGAALGALEPPRVARVTRTLDMAMQDMVEGGVGGVEGRWGGNVKLRVWKSEENGACASTFITSRAFCDGLCDSVCPARFCTQGSV